MIKTKMEPGSTEGSAKRHPLCNVRTVPVTDKRPLKVGDYLARDGAWNLKYKVLGITKGVNPWGSPAWLIKLEALGSYYADGRIEPVRRRTVREAWSHYYDNPEDQMAQPPSGYNRVAPVTRLKIVKGD